MFSAKGRIHVIGQPNKGRTEPRTQMTIKMT